MNFSSDICYANISPQWNYKQPENNKIALVSPYIWGQIIFVAGNVLCIVGHLTASLILPIRDQCQFQVVKIKNVF